MTGVFRVLQIRFTSKDNPAHTVKGKSPKTAKKIVMLAKGNHDMYKRRRMPDGLEVQQMKVNWAVVKFET